MNLPHQQDQQRPGFPTDHFAAANEVEFTDIDLTNGRITGIAVPVAGPKPCALMLASQDHVIAIARAIRYTDIANEAGKRRGWCGFTIGGMAQALALGSDIQLRCVVSDRIFGQWSGHELSRTVAMPTRPFLSVMRLREELCRDGGCMDYRQVIPFAVDLADAQGNRALLEASYQYFLGRPLDPAGEQGYLGLLSQLQGIEQVWKTFVNSDEYKARRLVALPGPFEAGFTFPLDGIDNNRTSLAPTLAW